MDLKFDTYTVYARFFPTLIASLPLFVLWFFLSEFQQISSLVKYILDLRFLGKLSLSLVFLYFFAQLIRVTSKFFEHRYFTGGKGFPTTYLMTYKDKTFSSAYKDKYRGRIKKFFDLDLLNEKEESNDNEEARRRLNEVTKHVVLKVSDGKLVKKHNIWYGFFRNLAGGIIYSVVFCMINISVSIFIIKNSILTIVSFVLLICFLFVLILNKRILIQNGEAYAKQLIAEFMMLQ